MIYKIYEELLPIVERKIKRIARKCANNGNPFTYEKIGEELVKSEEEDGVVRYYNFILIEVEGTAKIDDWEFIAVCEIHKDGNIIRKYNTEIEVPERFRYSENVCEHCNQKRNRKNLYIIHNVKTDEWKQVGKNCLALYTGGLNAEYVAAYMEGIIALEENNGVIGGNANPLYDIREIVKYAACIIDKVGYFNSNAFLPTKYLVFDMLSNKGIVDRIRELNKDLDRHDINTEFTKNDFDKDGIEKRIDAIIDYWKNVDDNSDFTHNIKAMIKLGAVSWKNVGFITYMPEGYNKYILNEERKRIEREERAKEQEGFFGNVGDRIKDAKVRYIKVLYTFETQYGISQICKIVLEDGRSFYWTGKGIEYYRWNGKEDIEIVPNKISFTIKEHGLYKGNEQTKVTRCKIEYIDKKGGVD